MAKQGRRCTVNVLIVEPMYAVEETEGLLARNAAVYSSGSPVFLREPIASEYLAGYLRYKGVAADVLQQTTEDDFEMLSRIEHENPRILGVSLHSTHMVPRVMRFLRRCRRRFPDLVIVCGGAHPTGTPEMVKEDCIDFIVVGEGEETLHELTVATLEGRNTDNIKGLAFMKNGRARLNPPRDRFDFSQRFWPIRKREILERVKSAPLAYPPPSEQKGVAQIAYSRGCPFKCKFCVSPIVFPGQPLYRNPNDVIDEMKYLKEEFGTNFVFFTDLTFSHYQKKVYDLCDRMIEVRLNMNWFAYVSVHLQPDVVEKMAEAGCTRVGMGAESLTDFVLKDVKPQQRVFNTKKALELTDKYGILNRTYFMLGYPTETKETLAATFEVMKSLPIDQPRLAFITPFPGTPFYREMKTQLITNDPERFTGDLPVIRNPNITPEEYVESRDRILIDYYSSESYEAHVRDKCARHPHFVDSFRFFLEYLKKKQLIERSAYSKLAFSLGNLVENSQILR